MSALSFVLSLLAATDGTLAADQGECAADPAYAQLDFWLGDWQVFANHEHVGTNRIEKILDGCVVVENWRDDSGSQGKSWFFYDPSIPTWKQVWVTDRARRPGGTKQKTLIARLADGSLQFQGQVRGPSGAQYLDRTTLTPTDHGEVRQLIEYSTDGASTWRVSFDGVYRRTQDR